MKKVALYLRVSTEEQKKHGLSVDNQLKALTEYANDNGLTIAGIYNDAGISARKKYTHRPALLQLLEDCKQHKIETILFTKLDRWFRSVADYYEVQTQLDKYGVKWRAIWEDYEIETSAGLFKVNIMLSVAQNEADRTRERVKNTLQYKAERGDYVGSVPYGYVKKDNKVYKDENAAEGLSVFFREYLTHFDARRACLTARDYGFTFPSDVLHRILRNPIYAGTARNGYKVDAYITEEEFKTITETIDKNVRHSKDNTVMRHEYIFSGLMYCDKCGARMVASCDKEYRIKTGKYWLNKKYKCPKYAVEHPEYNQIRENVVESFLMEKIDGIIDERIESAVIENKPVADNRAKKSALEQKLKRIADLYADGDISLDDYRTKRDNIKQEIAALDARPESVPAKLPDEWKDIYNQLDVCHKRAFWMNIIDKIKVFRGEITIVFR